MNQIFLCSVLLYYNVCVLHLAFDKQKVSDKVNRHSAHSGPEAALFMMVSNDSLEHPHQGWLFCQPGEMILTSSSFTLPFLVSSKMHYLFVMTYSNTVAKCLANIIMVLL